MKSVSLFREIILENALSGIFSTFCSKEFLENGMHLVKDSSEMFLTLLKLLTKLLVRIQQFCCLSSTVFFRYSLLELTKNPTTSTSSSIFGHLQVHIYIEKCNFNSLSESNSSRIPKAFNLFLKSFQSTKAVLQNTVVSYDNKSSDFFP